MHLTAQDHRDGALARLNDANKLYDCKCWCGAVYLAGRAVEAVLRALLLAKNGRLEVGHDLRVHLRHVRSIGLMAAVEDDPVDDGVNELSILWRNDLRFTGDQKFRGLLKDAKRLRYTQFPKRQRITGEPEKANVLSLLNAAEAVVARGDLAWSRLRRS